jgi:hypothetical protein
MRLNNARRSCGGTLGSETLVWGVLAGSGEFRTGPEAQGVVSPDRPVNRDSGADAADDTKPSMQPDGTMKPSTTRSRCVRYSTSTTGGIDASGVHPLPEAHRRAESVWRRMGMRGLSMAYYET